MLLITLLDRMIAWIAEVCVPSLMRYEPSLILAANTVTETGPRFKILLTLVSVVVRLSTVIGMTMCMVPASAAPVISNTAREPVTEEKYILVYFPVAIPSVLCPIKDAKFAFN